jgi:hypothetical protein
MKTFIEDDDLQTGQPAVAAPAATVPASTPTDSTPTQQTAPAPAPAQPVAAAAPTVNPADFGDDEPVTKPAAKSHIGADDDLDVSLGDDKLMSKSDGLDILRPEKGKTVRFALLTAFLSPKRAFNHYIEKKGTYRCLSTQDSVGICCQKLGESQPQIVALALHYTNADPKTGKYHKDAQGHIPAPEWEIKFVRMTKTAFQKVSRLVPEDQNPNDPNIDIIMYHRDAGFGYDYTMVSAARWKAYPEIVKAVTAAVQPLLKENGAKLIKKLGKKVTPLEFRAVIAGAVASEEADISNIDDIN